MNYSISLSRNTSCSLFLLEQKALFPVQYSLEALKQPIWVRKKRKI